MSFSDLLINTCTTKRFTTTGTDDYGKPTGTWDDHLVDEPCRLMMLNGVEIKVGALVVIVDCKLFIGDVDILESDVVEIDSLTYQIVFVKTLQDSDGDYHKECLLVVVRDSTGTPVPSADVTFLDLTDTPGTYAGQALLYPRVNATEDGLEFVAGGGGVTDHGALTGLADNDHPQYITHSLATAANDFLVASGAGVFIKKTLAQTKTILGIAADIAAAVAAHAGVPAAHHARYTDGEAVTAMGVLGDANPLNHDKYTDAEVAALIAVHTALTAAHHARYTDAEAVVAAKTVKLDDFTTPDDNTDLDASAAKHGLMPKADSSKLAGIEASAVALATVKADADIADAISKKHTRQHSITDTNDHTSTATANRMLKADANGLPVDATNTDAQVSGAVSASHTQNTDTNLGAVGTKNPPIDADKVLYRDSAAADAVVTSTWAQVKAFLKTYFDTIYDAVGTAAAAVAAHAALTTGIHGVGASTIESASGSQSKVDTHSALTTGVHGVGASTVCSESTADSKITTHAAIAAAHHAKYTDAEAIVAAKTVKLDDFAATDDNTDLDATVAAHGLMPKADKSKLDGIEAGADVTDATNVDAAGAVMESDYNAQSVLGAVSDNVPTVLTIAELEVLGRKLEGNIANVNIKDHLVGLSPAYFLAPLDNTGWEEIESGGTATAACWYYQVQSNATTGQYAGAVVTRGIYHGTGVAGYRMRSKSQCTFQTVMTDGEFWFGWFEDDINFPTTTSEHYAFRIYNDDIYASNGHSGSGTQTDTGLNLSDAPTGAYEFFLKYMADNIKFYLSLDGGVTYTLLATHTTNRPTAVGLYPGYWVKTTENANKQCAAYGVHVLRGAE